MAILYSPIPYRGHPCTDPLSGTGIETVIFETGDHAPPPTPAPAIFPSLPSPPPPPPTPSTCPLFVHLPLTQHRRLMLSHATAAACCALPDAGSCSVVAAMDPAPFSLLPAPPPAHGRAALRHRGSLAASLFLANIAPVRRSTCCPNPPPPRAPRSGTHVGLII